jgi:uncharacterized membrane protein
MAGSTAREAMIRRILWIVVLVAVGMIVGVALAMQL